MARLHHPGLPKGDRDLRCADGKFFAVRRRADFYATEWAHGLAAIAEPVLKFAESKTRGRRRQTGVTRGVSAANCRETMAALPGRDRGPGFRPPHRRRERSELP